MNGIVKALVLVVGLLAIGLGVAAWQAATFLDEPLALPEDGLAFEIRSGSAFATVANDLANAGVLERPRWLR